MDNIVLFRFTDVWPERCSLNRFFFLAENQTSHLSSSGVFQEVKSYILVSFSRWEAYRYEKNTEQLLNAFSVNTQLSTGLCERLSFFVFLLKIF